MLVLLLALLFYGLELFRITLRPGEADVGLGTSAAIAAIMLIPPSSVALVVFLGTSLAEIRFTRPWYKKAFNVSQWVIAATTVAWAFQYVKGDDPFRMGSMRDIAAIVMVWVGYYVLNACLVTLAISLALSIPPLIVWRTNHRNVVYHEIFTAPLGTLLALLIHEQPLTAVLLLPPVYMLHRAVKLTTELRRQTTKALIAFANSIDDRDPMTYQHSLRVAELARAVARQMGLPPHEVETIYLSACVHDLGKVGIPDAILLKPGRLSDEEFDTIKQHPVISEKIVQNFPIFGIGHDIVRHHHERYDGKGYPDKVAGEAIPLGARIIAVADTYDAITADRPYRPGMPHEKALKIIIEERGKQLDARVVDAFLEVMGVISQALVPEVGNWRIPATYASSREEKVSVPA
jgi:hypothetical protein